MEEGNSSDPRGRLEVRHEGNRPALRADAAHGAAAAAGQLLAFGLLLLHAVVAVIVVRSRDQVVVLGSSPSSSLPEWWEVFAFGTCF